MRQLQILLRSPTMRSTASSISGIVSYDQANSPAMQPSVPILAQARGSVLRRTTGPKDVVHNYSATYPCDNSDCRARIMCSFASRLTRQNWGAPNRHRPSLQALSSARARPQLCQPCARVPARRCRRAARSSGAPSPSLHPKLQIDATQ